MLKRNFLRFVFYRLVRIFCLFIGAVVIGILWLPMESGYTRCDNAIIQKNDWIIGYRASYYSVLSNDLPIPCYATHVVALSGRKDIGFTPVIAGEVGRTCINYNGFIVLVIIHTVSLYVIANIYEFFRLAPSKENYFVRILFQLFKKSESLDDSEKSESLDNKINMQ